MKKWLLPALAGAVVIQIWSMISWMGIGWHSVDFQAFPDEAAIVATFSGQELKDGIYLLPNMDHSKPVTSEYHQEWNSKAESGPYAFMNIVQGGINPHMGPAIGKMFVLNLLVCMGLLWLVSHMKTDCPIGRTIMMVTAIMSGTLLAQFGYLNWWKFPVMYTVINIVDMLITWALGAGAMNFVVKKLKA